MGPSPQEQIESERKKLSASRATIKQLADQRHPLAGPELTLAMRAVEDARMRLGVALTYINGQDPFPKEDN